MNILWRFFAFGTNNLGGHTALNVTIVFLKIGQTRPLFVYFRSFHMTFTINDKSVDGVFGTRTRVGRQRLCYRAMAAPHVPNVWLNQFDASYLNKNQFV